MKAIFINYLILLLSIFSTALSEKPPGKNAIRLSNVQTLTLRADRKTSHRRVSPIPQLKCVGPSQICKLYEVDIMRCTNQGYDYDEEDIQWSCTASLPEEFKLGSTDVICEGYRNADDKWILKGSCGVEYRLLLMKRGEQHYGMSSQDRTSSGKIESYLFAILFVFVLVIIIFAAFSNNNDRNNRRGRRGNNNQGWPWGGGGDGGGGGGDNDPPPPYSYRPEPQYKRHGSSDSGFWTGATVGSAAGAAAGYAMGRRHNRQNDQQTRAGPSYTRRDDFDRDSLRSSSTFSSTRTNTGFGSTRRR